MIYFIPAYDKIARKEEETEKEHKLRLVELYKPFKEEKQNFNIKLANLSFFLRWFYALEKTQDPQIELDTETIKNVTDPSGHVYTFQAGNHEHQFVFDATCPENLKVIKLVLSSKIRKLLQNAKYDIKWFLKWGINPTNIYDTMLTEIVINCGYRMKEVGIGLDKLGDRYLDIPISKEIRGKINYLGLSPPVIDYAAGDVTYLGKIRKQQLTIIKNKELENVVDLENQVVRVFAEMEYNGIRLDPDKWMQVYNHHVGEVGKAEAKLHSYLLNHPVKKYLNVNHTLFDGEQIANLNFNSSPQVIDVINKVGKSIGNTDLMKIDSVSEKFIESYAYIDDFIGHYLEYKEQKTLVSKYGKAYLKNINLYTGRIHTDFWQIKDTGRVSSSNPNLQQIAAGSKHRNAFIPERGYKFVGADFSSQELILIAEDSKDPVWMEACRKGYDLHSFVAEMVFKNKWHKETEEGCIYKATKHKCSCKGHKKLRDIIKTVNYALAYGASYFKLAATLRISPEEAKQIISDYFGTMKRLEISFNSLAKYGRDNLMMRTFKPYRRIRHFYPPSTSSESQRFKDIGAIERQSMNSRYQGTGADMMKLAMVRLFNHFKQKYKPEDVKFTLQVHDELILEVKEDLAEQVLKEQIEIMTGVSSVFLKELTVGAEGQVMDFWEK